ncbi:Unknown protein, partial [Striga hermonthica]
VHGKLFFSHAVFGIKCRWSHSRAIPAHQRVTHVHFPTSGKNLDDDPSRHTRNNVRRKWFGTHHQTKSHQSAKGHNWWCNGRRGSGGWPRRTMISRTIVVPPNDPLVRVRNRIGHKTFKVYWDGNCKSHVG